MKGITVPTCALISVFEKREYLTEAGYPTITAGQNMTTFYTWAREMGPRAARLVAIVSLTTAQGAVMLPVIT
jgi:hypothetical protein